MFNNLLVSRNMPQKFGVSDGGNSFILGRSAFFNNTSISHQNKNLPNNSSSTNSVKTNRLKTESGNNPSPLPEMSNSTRIQRLRLGAIGGGSYKLKNNDDYISYKAENYLNVVKHAKTSVRGGGAAYVPKSNSKRV
tara:strand:+ start:291 stop:698 length:408 start_codon:yes stop_codon:yes gene_type:complete